MDVLTSDNQTVSVPKQVYEKSEILKYTFEEFGKDTIFPLPNVDSSVLNLIIHYTLNDVKITENRENLFAMAMATDFLNMPELLDKTCIEIAEILKGKSPKEIRSILNISSNNTIG
jgi:S-phase kinase-associated protein 1